MVEAIPGEEILPRAWEETGIPSFGRAGEAFGQGEMGMGALHSGLGALGVLGMAPGVGKGVRPVREAAEGLATDYASRMARAKQLDQEMGFRFKRERTRDWSDVPLSKRMNDKEVTAFLEEHGITYGDGPNTYSFDGDEIIARAAVSGPGTRSTSFSQKTFRDPTLKQMRDWMGY
jgi:hypothetical protein